MSTIAVVDVITQYLKTFGPLFGDIKKKIYSEILENQKNPERIATSKGQNLQNLENTKKRNEEIENELLEAEKKYSSINQNIKETQTKLR